MSAYWGKADSRQMLAECLLATDGVEKGLVIIDEP
jgi:hypothetical protein